MPTLQIAPTKAIRHFGTLSTLTANFDIVVLFCLIMADVRVFKGNSVASFTLFELFVWGYSAPIVVSRLGIQRTSLAAPCLRFLVPLGLYVAWLLIVSVVSIVTRGDSEVFQDTKNVVPALILVLFVFVRIRDEKPVVLLCNLFVIYSLVACILGLIQYKFGAPYFRELIAGAEYKLDLEGDIVSNPVVGFSRHPNEFAMAILPGLTLAVLKLNAEIRDGWHVRPITVIATIVMCAGIALSSARGAMLFTGAAIIFIASPLGKICGFWLKLAWVAILTVFVVLYGFHQAETSAPGIDTIETRYLLWQTSFNGIASDSYVLLFGDGMHFVEKWSEQLRRWEFPDSHNAWIDQILYFRFIRLGLVFGDLAGIFWYCRRPSAHASGTRASVARRPSRDDFGING